MKQAYPTSYPQDASDTEGAQRFLEEFTHAYRPVFTSAQSYLGRMIQGIGPQYAAAYSPWHNALEDISRGLYLLSRKISLPDMQGFLDALHMFTFEGALQFLGNLCRQAQLSLPRNWEKQFKEQIDMLLFSLSILQRQKSTQLAR